MNAILNTVWIIILIFILYSCNSNDNSGIDNMYVDEDFIISKVEDADSIYVDSLTSIVYPRTVYCLSDGSIVKVIHYKDGKIAAWFHYDNHGQIIDGAEVSEKTGHILGKLSYREGQLHGKVIYFYENGNIRSEGQFDNGERVGEWKNYNINGGVESTNNY